LAEDHFSLIPTKKLIYRQEHKATLSVAKHSGEEQATFGAGLSRLLLTGKLLLWT